MQPATNSWPTTKGAMHVLLFAQNLREMLTKETYESFRVQTLDVLTRFREVKQLIKQLQNNEVRRASLIPPIEELAASINSDPAIDKISNLEIEYYVELLTKFCKSNEIDLKKLAHLTEYVESVLEGGYKSVLEERLISSIDRPERKDELRQLIQSYCALLINRGYSRSFILRVSIEIFFTSDILKADRSLIRKFVRKFDFTERTYNAFIPVHKGTISFLNSLEVANFVPLSRSALSKSLQNAVDQPQFSEKDFYFRLETKSLDPFSASETARQVLRILISTTFLENRGVRLMSRPYSFIQEKGKRSITKVEKDAGRLQSIINFTTKRQGSRVRGYARSVINDFSKNSSERILSASESASLARFSDNAETQLTLIWSSIEVLFGDPPEGTSRIGYYQNCLIPCICLNYAWRYSAAVFSSLSRHHRKSLERALDVAEVPSDGDSLQRFQRFIFDLEFAPSHQALLESISGDPLAMNRLFRLHRNFGTPSMHLRSINDHEQRVRWQIARIYRARNDFIHAGRKHPFVAPLALNAFEYFKTAFHAIIFRSKKEEYKREVEFFQSSLDLAYTARLRDLAKLTVNDQVSADFLKHFTRI